MAIRLGIHIKVWALYLLLLIASRAGAQGISTSGKDFWLGFLKNLNSINTDDPQLMIYITGSKTTTGTATMQNQLWSANFTVNAGQVTVLEVPFILGMYEHSEIADKRSIRITTQDSVTVYAANALVYSTDASLIYPSGVLGSEYITLDYHTNWDSQFLVLATEDATEVQITPRSTTKGGRTGGVPFTVTLNKGEGYPVMSTQDLSGSLIQSKDPCKKIAVFSSAACTNIPSGATACDHLFEQNMASEYSGKKYFAVPLSTRKNGDTYRVLATHDNTTVYKNSLFLKKLNRGEFFEYREGGPSIIQADYPVLLAQYSNSSSVDGVNSDPFMMYLLPHEQRKQRFTYSTIARNITDHYLNLIVPSSASNQVLINGAPPGVPFKKFALDPEWSWAQIPVGINQPESKSHTLEIPGGGMAYAYGFGNYESYGFAAGADLRPIWLDFLIPQSVCVGKKVQFFGLDDYSSAPFKWTWDMGDGTTKNGQNIEHTYSAPGKYKVCFKRILQSGLCQGGESVTEVCKDLIVTEGTTARILGDSVVCRGQALNFEALGGTKWAWKPQNWFDAPDSMRVKAQPDQSGWIYLESSDPKCPGTGKDSIWVEVLPQPRAWFTWSRIDSLRYRFSADTLSQEFSFYWDFGDRSTPDTHQTVQHTYVQEDSFVVRLIVANSCGTDSVICVVPVGSAHPNDGNSGACQTRVGTSPYSNDPEWKFRVVNPIFNNRIQVFSQLPDPRDPLELRFITPRGQVIFEQKMYEHQNYLEIGTSDWEAGIYFMHVKGRTGSFIYKLILN